MVQFGLSVVLWGSGKLGHIRSVAQTNPKLKTHAVFYKSTSSMKSGEKICAVCRIFIMLFYCPERSRIVAARLRPSQLKRGLIVYKISKRAKLCLLIHTAKKISHVWYCLAKG